MLELDSKFSFSKINRLKNNDYVNIIHDNYNIVKNDGLLGYQANQGKTSLVVRLPKRYL